MASPDSRPQIPPESQSRRDGLQGYEEANVASTYEAAVTRLCYVDVDATSQMFERPVPF